MPRTLPIRVFAVALPVVMAALAGCAASGTTDDDTLRQEVAASAGLASAPMRTGDTAALTARINELLAQPLRREDAVTLALLNNPAIARRFAELRIDAAERVRASRPPNPALSLGRLTRGNETENERGISLDLIGLLAWPFNGGVADRQFAAARAAALQDALTIAADTRAAWTDAIAAGNALRYAQAVADAAATGQLYAERLAAAGSGNRLETAQAKAFRIDADIGMARAQGDAHAAREQLLQLLGLADPARLQLPDELPPLPAAALSQQEAGQRGIDQRLDVQAARRHAEATAKSLRLTRLSGVINVLDVNYQSNTSNLAATQTGPGITLELPLFDFGTASRGEARARYDIAVADVIATAVRAQSELRSAWLRYQSAWQLARRYQDEALPLTADITREMLLRHNGMLVGPFELLAQAREQAAATAQWHELLRDFWLADAALAAALTGNATPAATTTSAETR